MASNKELMDWIRANLGTLPTDIRSESFYDPMKDPRVADPFGGSGIGVRGQEQTPNSARYLSDTLSRLLPGASIYDSTPEINGGGGAGVTQYAVGRGGKNFRIGDVSAMYDTNGRLVDVVEHKPDSLGFNLMRVIMPAVAMGAGGAAALGAGAAAGGAGAAAVPTSGGYFGGLSAGAGGTTGLTAGAAGAAGITAPAGFVLAPEIGAGVAAAGGAAGGYMGGLNPAQSGLGLQMPSAPSLGSMGGAQGIVPATVAPMSAESLIPFGTQAATAPSLVQQALSAARSVGQYAQLAGPVVSLLGGAQQLGALPQQPADAPRLPGAEAPPEARGWQAGVAPILDVLDRNRRAGKSRTALTGSRGVNMSSTRVGANSLLGL